MKRILYVFVLSLAGLGFGSNEVRSATITWNGSVSSDWNNATNWLPQQIPATNDHVIFNSGTLTAPTNGVFAIMDWTGGAISGSLTVKSNAVLNISGSLAKTLFGSLTNAGTVIATSTIYLQLYYSPPTYYGAIYNLPGALFDIQNDQFYLYYAFGTEFFNNAGTLRKSAGSGITQSLVQLINTGLVDAQTGTISFNRGGALAGQFNTAASTTINFANGNFAAGTPLQLTGAGAFQFNGTMLTLTNNVIPNLQMLSGTLALGPVFQGGSITNLTLAGTSLTGTNTVTGVATLGGGGSGVLTVASNGVVNWTGGAISGSLTVKSNAVLNVTGASGKILYGSLTNAGKVVATGTSYLQIFNPGTFYNLPGALFDIQNDQFYLYYAYGTEFFNNAGTLRKSAGSGTTQILVQLINTGLVDAQTGTISFGEGGTIAGQFNTAASTTINFANGNFAAGTPLQLTGAGAFQFNGATLTLTNNVIPNLQMLGGALALGPAFQGGSITNLTLPGTSLTGTNTVTGVATLGGGGSGVLTVASNGVVNWTGGGISGSVTVKSNAVLNVTGPSSKILFATLTNAGTVVAMGASYLQIFNPGAFYNLPGALFDIQNDQFYLYYGYGTEFFNNAGTLRKSAGTGTTAIYPLVTNTGLIEADSGTISFQNIPNLNGGEVRFGLSSLSNFGKINISGNANLAGTVGVAWLGGYVPNTNNSFTVLSYGSHTGIFTGLDLPAAALWATNYTATTFTVTVASINILMFTTQPVGGKLTNVILAPIVVQVETPTGVPVATNGVPITLSLASGGGLQGTLIQNTDASGKVTFSDLKFNQTGFKTLRASSASQTAATSVAFKIVAVEEAQWTTNGFVLSLYGSNNIGTTIIYATTNLLSAWKPIYTNPPTTNAIQFLDTASTNYRARFYRAVEQ